MPASARTLKALMEAGVCGDKLVEIVGLIDADMTPPKDTAAERRRAYDRKRNRRTNHPDRPAPDEWHALRNFVVERDDRRCTYCEDHVGQTLTADHVVPLSRGGTNDPANLTCACLPCNSSKRHLLLSEWTGRSTARQVRDFSHLVERLDA